MPRRDGQPTAEEIARAQQRGRGAPPPPPPGSGPPPEAVATAALAATAGAVASAGVVAGTVAAEAAVAAAIADASAGILAAFDRFLTFRITEQQDEIEELLVTEAAALSAEERLAIVAEELQRLRAFTAKARDRLAEDLPQALRVRDKADREEAVKALLERERRYVRQQEEASHGRVLGHAHASAVRKASPEGAYWRKRANCCERCDVMGGKVWPWSVLDIYRPPLHPHCEENCALWTIAEAGRMGWITEADYRARDDMPGGDIMEAVAEAFDVDPDDLEDALALIEARYDRRYPKGTAQGGKFRPRRGGVVTPAMGRARRRRGLPDAPEVMSSPVKVTPAGDRLDVRDLKVADLKVGDRLLFDGEFQEVVEVKRPGVVELSEDGLVFIDRETVRGVPAKRTPDPAPPAPPPPAGGPAYDDIIALTRGKRPSEATELLAGIHFDPDRKRSEARDGDLYLPPGFYGLTRANREAVVFRHLGRQLAEGLGDKGIADLAEQDPHLRSRKAVVDTYYAINSPARERMAELHPDAARLVATAAQEKGLPLHPEAATLVGEPASADQPPERHPAHRLADGLVGLQDPEARSALAEAGYVMAGMSSGDDVVYRNHEAGATVTTRLDTRTLGQVEAATVEVNPELDRETQVAITRAIDDWQGEGLDAYMRDQGFYRSTRVGEYMEYVSVDGRGVAWPVDGPQAGTPRTFTPTPNDVRASQANRIGADPLVAIKPGDNLDDVQTALRGAGYRGLSKQGGVFDYTRVSGGEREEVRIRVNGDGTKVAEVGRPAFASLDVTDDETYQREREERRRAREEEERKHAQAAADATDRVGAAIRGGDADALKEMLDGMTASGAVSFLRQHGVSLSRRRRSRTKEGAPQITYTLLGPNHEEIAVTGGLRFSDQSITKVTIKGNPQGGRTRLPFGQAPATLDEHLSDALGRADELASRFGVEAFLRSIQQGGVARGAAAHYEPSNGTIRIGKTTQAKRIRTYLKLRASGKPIDDRTHIGFYDDLETLQHEINHSVFPNAKRGRLAYGGIDKNIEESLTEETAHLLTVEWLRSYGFTDVLQAVKRNPRSDSVLGVYRDERVQLKAILDDAGVPEADRAELLYRMKFQMTSAERHAELVRLSGAPNAVHAMQGRKNSVAEQKAEAARRRRMRGMFEPAVRPDLSDVEGEVEPLVLPDGRKLMPGDEVTVEWRNGQMLTGQIAYWREYPGGSVIVNVVGDDGTSLSHTLDKIQ